MLTDVQPAGETQASIRLNTRALATVVAASFALTYPVCLWQMFHPGGWIFGPNGHPTVTDFMVFWLAGQSALKGAAAAAYVPQLHHAAEAAMSGHAFAGQLPWRNSPLFFFVAAPLALLPYMWAFIAWVAGSLAIYSIVVWRIARIPLALTLACATPAVFLNAICGQNGTLSAALMGAALLTLERRPVVSGILIGLLSYKPQFGILFPVALLACGHRRAFVAAAVTCVTGALISALAFGTDSWRAFLHYLPITSNEILVHGINGFNKLQTMYGLMRWLGFGNDLAWTMQTGLAGIAGVALFWLWRRDVPFALKAAALPVATLLVTPHLFMYDFPLLAVSYAFLYRERSFDSVEFWSIGLANLCIGAFLFLPSPIGLIALAISAALIIRRAMQTQAANVPAHLSLQVA
jgi:arabinofuranan 3-O-arabinosyltransferase